MFNNTLDIFRWSASSVELEKLQSRFQATVMSPLNNKTQLLRSCKEVKINMLSLSDVFFSDNLLHWPKMLDYGICVPISNYKFTSEMKHFLRPE